MSSNRLVFIADAGAAEPSRAGTTYVVVDTAWTPGPDARADIVPIRRPTATILARTDLVHEALERVDTWAGTADLVDILTVDGVSYWFRLRETLWNWLHERLLWWRIVAESAGDGRLDALEIHVDEPGLADIATALSARGDTEVLVRPPVAAAPPTVVSPAPAVHARGPWRGRAARLFRLAGLGQPPQGPSAAARTRAGALDERAAAWRDGTGPRVIAVSLAVRHAIGSATDQRLVDPHLDSVVARLRADGVRTGVLQLGLDHRQDADWALLEHAPDVFPASLLSTRWKSPAAPRFESPGPRLPTSAEAPLDVGGLDLGAAILGEVRRFADRGLLSNARLGPAVGAMLDDLRPDAVLLTHEGHREPWIQASRRASVPTFAVQHGIIYPTHPGYAHPRHPARMLATRTFVYGEYERDVLVRHGAYRDDEVSVSGSPRLDLDQTFGPAATPGAQDRTADRTVVRQAIGVAAGDRLLVVSTTNGAMARRFYFADILGRLFDGPLPGVHVVFKQHPGEADEGPYRQVIEGLAAAGGWEPPPMTVIREIDLYRLLRAADAHLGFNSTVLTEAVLTGTPNLISAGQRYGDILGYVEAGVALPVRSNADLAAALAEPRAAEPAVRRAFLQAHFRDGDASARISATIRAEVAARAGSGAGRS